MCPHEIRKLQFSSWSKSSFHPLSLPSSVVAAIDEPVTIVVHVYAVTTAQSYSIFEAISSKDFGTALDLLSDHIGVNAVDEWGQSPLIVSIINRHTPLIAALLNAHHPKVDVNYTKPVCFPMIFKKKLSHHDAVVGILGVNLCRAACGCQHFRSHPQAGS
jgi:hypothetical protein